MAEIKFAYNVCKHVKSNAVVMAKGTTVTAVGAGQMSRVDSVKIGIRKVKEAGLNLVGSILASDAFFPFPDSIELAAKVKNPIESSDEVLKEAKVLYERYCIHQRCRYQ